LGINPQGAFSTVVGRLNDAYANIAAHVDGAPPRHPDTVIDSEFKPGTTFNLTAGSVNTQLQELLDIADTLSAADISTFLSLTDTPTGFIGHGEKFVKVAAGETILEFSTAAFVDLTDTPSTLAGNPSKLVGVNSGATALEFTDPVLDWVGLTDTPSSFSGQGNKLVRVNVGETGLEFITAATGVTAWVDLSDTPTNFVGQAGKVVSVNTGETALEFTAVPGSDPDYLTRAFDTFVVEGLAVTQNGGGPNFDVSAGFLHGSGLMVKFVGSTNTAPAGVGVNYVYASISSSSVVINVTQTIATAVGDTINPQVLLHTFTHAGGAWSASQDLRRYGSLVNNKNHLTVGKLSASLDGYGADFPTLKSAVEHVKAMSNSTVKIAPLRVILVSDITISTAAEMSIELAAGMEIDGAGRTISTTVDAPIFTVDSNSVRIHDLNVVWTFSSLPSSAALAKIGDTSSVSNIIVENCIQTDTSASTANRVPYFVRCGNSSGTNTVTGLMLVNNIAQVNDAGVNLLKPSATFQLVVNSAIINNNRFFQDASPANWVSTSESCIRVGDFCVVDGNSIEGGFNSGIEVEFSESTLVSNNMVNGGTGTNAGAGTPLMVTGIGIRTSGAGFSSRCLIADNIVKGITTIGIDDRIVGSGANVMISGNIVDNTFDNSNTMVGIQGRGIDTHIVGNIVLDAGDHGIENSSVTIGNQIANGLATMVSAIEITSSNTTAVGNFISNCPGMGIDANGQDNVVISSNYYLGQNASTTTPGIRTGGNSVISDNLVKDANGDGIVVADGYSVISGNKIITPDAGGITLSSSVVWSHLIGNYIESPAISGIFLTLSNDNTLIDGNMIYKGASTNSGIDVNTSDHVSILNNYIFRFDVSIDLSSSNQTHIVGNRMLGLAGDMPSKGVEIDATSSTVHVAGNYLDQFFRAIDVGGDGCSVVSNYVRNYWFFGISISTADDCLIASNLCESPATTTSIGIEVTGALRGMIGSNWAEGGSAGVAYSVPASNPASGLTMSGNYAKGGSIPNNFFSGVNIDVDNRHYN
jgi:hypothetical protein